jgi:SAM-dependent methyltransferase
MFPIQYTAHNWRIRKICNDNVMQNAAIFKGVLYDLGCGTKPYHDFIAPLVTQYIGVDWGNTIHTKTMDIVADLNKPLAIEDAVADTVVCFQTLEHLCEPQQLLNEAYRIMKPGAQILLTVPFLWSLHEEPHDYFRYTQYGLKYMFEKAGFRDVNVQADTGFWTTHALRLNYQTIRYQAKLGKWVNYLFMPMWFLNQTIAPFLDKLDTNMRDTSSYRVIAVK